MYIGVDLGTSSVKVILVDVNGTVHKTVTRSYDLIIPQPNWTEQDPNSWYEQTYDALKELVEGYESIIQGMGFSGQMHGLVVLDENDEIIRNALLWNDQRTTKEVDYLNNEIGLDKLIQYTGNIALTGLTAPKILWMKNNEPKQFNSIHKIMLPKDYLIYKLTGAFVSDVSDLSGTLFFNPKTKTYSKEMLNILGINETMLPAIIESYDVAGTLKQEIKDTLRLSQDCIVVPGGGDQAVGAVGVGIVESGECSISLGTSGVIFVALDAFTIDQKSHLQSYAHANGYYHIMAVMLNAAGAIKWWNESILKSNDYNLFYKQIENTKTNNTLYFLPYLTGERAPINDSKAKGLLYGMQIQHTQEDINRAVVEGVTFALKDSFELFKELNIDIKRIRITGGGAKSDLWVQMIADVMNVDVVKIKEEEGPALGAAILAMVGDNVFKDVASACQSIVKLSKSFKPDPKYVSHYETKYDGFKKLYPHIKGLYQKL